LKTARPNTPKSVRAAIEKALEKTPADRFRTAPEFAAALSTETSGFSLREAVTENPMRWTVSALTLVALSTALSLWLADGPDGAELDANKVMVFPLEVVGEHVSPDDGWNVALAMTAALEHTMPLKGIDGRSWLPDSVRSNPHALTADLALETSVERGAGSYIGGVIRSDGDSVSVSLRLFDVRGDSLIAQETSTGLSSRSSVTRLGLTAVTPLLTRLIEPDRDVDLTPLTNRDPGAVFLSIQGDREYRRPRFSDALEFYRRAIEEDSLLAFAAMKGAWAASWAREWAEAEALVGVAVRNDSLLPQKYRHFAAGLQAFFQGEADRAVERLREALTDDPGWSEARMALGEVYYHLLPTDAPLDSLAEAEFSLAFGEDTTFMPPLLHLTEIKIRAGELDMAEDYLRRLRDAEADSTRVRALTWSLECVRSEVGAFDWSSFVPDEHDLVLVAAQNLAAAGAQPACAAAGFRALIQGEEVPRGTKWGALQGLQGLLLAQGKPEEARALLHTALANGTRAVYSLYVFDVLAGAPFQDEATQAVAEARQGAGEFYAMADPQTRWLLGAWHASRREVDTAARVLQELHEEAEAREHRSGRIHARALSPHVRLAQGDTLGAISELEGLVPTARFNELAWVLGEPLPVERFRLAELQYEVGRFGDVLRTASIFDHPGPIMYLAFLRQSLVLRLKAAEQLGLGDLIRRYTERLNRLGWESDTES
jgi:tetratricopeptide (TPR) repeat protein